MIYKFQSSRSSKRIGLVVLVIATILLASCPTPPGPAPGTDPPGSDPVTDPPDPPANLMFAIGSGKVSLEWDPVTAASSYRVYRDGNETPLVMDLSDPSHIDTGLTNGTAYAYTVRAVGSAGESTNSNPVTATPRLRGDFNTLSTGHDNPYGIWGNTTTLWVSDTEDNKLYAYNLNDKTPDTDKDFALTPVNDDSISMWSNGATIWVADSNVSTLLYSYNLSTMMREDNDFGLHGDNGSRAGFWGNTTTLWVSDKTDDKLYAYSLTLGRARDSNKDIDLATGNTDPAGIWSNGTTMWVVDTVDGKLYAYNIASKMPDSVNDIDLATDNADPADIWSDGTTIWVADTVDDKLYAYNLITRAADPAEFGPFGP